MKTHRQRHGVIRGLIYACVLCVIAAQIGEAKQRPVKRKPVAAEDSTAPVEAGRMTDIRFWSLGDATRIAIEVTSGYKLHSERLQNPERLFFDIEGINPRRALGIERITVGDAFLRQIRVAESQPGTTRIVLDLAQASDFTATQLTNPERLIIELRAPGTAKRDTAPVPIDSKTFTPPRIEAAPPPTVPEPLAPPPAIVISRVEAPAIPVAREKMSPEKSTLKLTPKAPALPARKNASGDVSMTRVLGLKLGKVVIDAGHGGQDAGTRGPGGLLEKDLVLDVAKRLAVLVETRLGSQVIMTRADDTFVPLDERPRIANGAKADLFISVHANSSPVRSTSGVETYYLNFTSSKSALEVAARENATSDRSISDLKELIQQIALKEKLDESREFAAKVQNSMAALSARSNSSSQDRGVKKAPFVVLIGASMPAILAEIGFVTNTHDEAIMKKGEYRQKIAEALYRGLAQYAAGLSHFQVAQHKQISE